MVPAFSREKVAAHKDDPLEMGLTGEETVSRSVFV
jgi:hypothetical protein